MAFIWLTSPSFVVWPFINHKSGGCNKTGLVLALLAIYNYSTRPTPNASYTSQKKTAPSIPQHTSRVQNVWLGALPLGSLLFCIHNLLSDSSTLIAWSWTGYENRLPRGPLPHLHGSLTLVSMVLGTVLGLWSSSSSRSNPTSNPLAHPIWFHFGAAASYVMYKYRNWPGYLGGLGVAFFLMSILPHVFETAASASVAAAVGSHAGERRMQIAKTYTIAMGLYCLLNLASIFTVAYAFVPGGVYLRERTDL